MIRRRRSRARLRLAERVDGAAEAAKVVDAIRRSFRRSTAVAWGKIGVTAMKAFLAKGGTVVTLGMASNFAMDKLGVRARNVLAGKTTKEFWCPGSTLKVSVDNTSPLGYGMPTETLALYLQGDPVFEVTPSSSNERYAVIASYEKREILQSGWLVGEGNITGKAAMISAEVGKGKVVLVGFRTQHRAQTYGTFKLLFNSLVE